jgi:hypothetical protein
VDPIHNISFQTNFIYSTLKKIQTVKAHQIVRVAQSTTFLFSCILAVFVFTCLLSICFCPTLFLNMLQCILKCIVQFFAYLMEKIVNIMTLFGQMLCSMYKQHCDQRNNVIPPSVLTGQATHHQTDNQQPLENQDENVHFIPFSPMTAVLSLPAAATAPPSPQLQSTAQKALRFLNMPVRARESESVPQRLQPAAQPVILPTAPHPPTFIYRDLPGTPRRLF